MSAKKIAKRTAVIRKRERRSLKELIGYISSIAIFISGSLIYIYPRVKMVNIVYSIEAGKKRMDRLLKRRKELRLEIATLKRPKRIEDIARSKYGFILPHADRIVYIKKGSP